MEILRITNHTNPFLKIIQIILDFLKIPSELAGPNGLVIVQSVLVRHVFSIPDSNARFFLTSLLKASPFVFHFPSKNRDWFWIPEARPKTSRSFFTFFFTALSATAFMSVLCLRTQRFKRGSMQLHSRRLFQTSNIHPEVFLCKN